MTKYMHTRPGHVDRPFDTPTATVPEYIIAYAACLHDTGRTPTSRRWTVIASQIQFMFGCTIDPLKLEDVCNHWRANHVTKEAQAAIRKHFRSRPKRRK